MPLPQWKSALNQDLVLYFYLRDHKHQMLLFLDTMRILGLTLSLFEPGNTQRTILENHELEDEAMIQLALVHRQIRAMEEKDEPNQAKLSAQGQVERTLEVILEALEPTSGLQETLYHPSRLIVKTITSGSALSKGLEQIQDLAERLLNIGAVVPLQLLQTVMWLTALIERVCKELGTVHIDTHGPRLRDVHAKVHSYVVTVAQKKTYVVLTIAWLYNT